MTDVEPHPRCLRLNKKYCREGWCYYCANLYKLEGLDYGPKAPAGAGVPDPAARPRERDDRLDGAFVDVVYSTLDAAAKLLLQKHLDYGPKNIADAPGGALNGLRVRMHDKLARINNLVDTGAEPQNESLRDSFVDLLCYSAISLLVVDGHWPGVGDPVMATWDRDLARHLKDAH